MNKWSSFPAIIGFETNNQYEIKNSMGQKIFHAKENTDCCTRNICGPLRSFELQIKDNFDQEVIHLTLWLCSGQIDPKKIFFFPKIQVNVIALDSNLLTLFT